MSDSPTPRTDAELKDDFMVNLEASPPEIYVSDVFARTLERELNEINAELGKARHEAAALQLALVDQQELNVRLERELDTARQEAEQAKCARNHIKMEENSKWLPIIGDMQKQRNQWRECAEGLVNADEHVANMIGKLIVKDLSFEEAKLCDEVRNKAVTRFNELKGKSL